MRLNKAKQTLFAGLEEAEYRLKSAHEAVPRSSKETLFPKAALSPSEWQKRAPMQRPFKAVSQKSRLEEFTKALESQSAAVIKLATSKHIPATLIDLLCKKGRSPQTSLIYHGDNSLIKKCVQATEIKAKNITKISNSDFMESEQSSNAPIIALSTAAAAASETGTLFFTASQANPTALNFISSWHIALIEEDDILSTYEEAYDHCLAKHQFHPQTINMISGPSRTADIEQTLTLGAHGPIKLTVIIYE